MGLLFGGGSSSASSLNSSIAFNPIINVGDDNDAESTTKQRGTADATATTKDEFGMTASVGVGVGGGSGSGGPATSSRMGDTQPMSKTPVSDGNFFDDGIFSKLKNINPLFIVGGIFLIGGSYFIIKKRKK